MMRQEGRKRAREGTLTVETGEGGGRKRPGGDMSISEGRRLHAELQKECRVADGAQRQRGWRGPGGEATLDEGTEGVRETGGAGSWAGAAMTAATAAIRQVAAGLGGVWNRVTGKRGREEQAGGTARRRRTGDG